MHESKHYNENDINKTLNITNSTIKEKSLDKNAENIEKNENTYSGCQISKKDNNGDQRNLERKDINQIQQVEEFSNKVFIDLIKEILQEISL